MGLHRLIDRVVKECAIYGMMMNCNKTDMLIISKKDFGNPLFTANKVTVSGADTVHTSAAV